MIHKIQRRIKLLTIFMEIPATENELKKKAIAAKIKKMLAARIIDYLTVNINSHNLIFIATMVPPQLYIKVRHIECKRKSKLVY
jgi:hypothetical protein